MDLLLQIIPKGVVPTYPNVEKLELEKEKENAMEDLSSNDNSGEVIWRVLTEITENLAGFLFSLILFLSLDPVLILLFVVTAGFSFLCSRREPKWVFDFPATSCNG